MGGDEGGDTTLEQVRQDSACQRRAFDRIGTGTQFVEDDQ